MSAGMSDGAFRGRRDRLLRRAIRAAESAGLEATRQNARAVIRAGGAIVSVGMGRGSMSNGETVLEPFVIVERSGRKARTFGAFTWMPYDAPARDFWRGLNENPPRWDANEIGA